MIRSMSTVLAATTLLLAGCAGLRQVDSDVSTYGEWPAGRAPGSYVFERLPSQQARAAEQAQLEAAAEPALQKAGFVPATQSRAPDVLVQVGARITRTIAYAPWDDPLWWHGGFGHWRGRPWHGPYWGFAARIDATRYDREVAVLIRDRSSGKPLYEARAASDGLVSGGTVVLGAMFEAALKDFPRAGLNPRRVVVTLPENR